MPAEDPTPPRQMDREDDAQEAQAEQTRVVHARPATVWSVLADPQQRRHVLGGDLDVDLVEGAEGTWTSPAGGSRPVKVHRVEHDRRLTFDWGSGDDVSTVDIRLEPTTTGTTVHVVERRRVGTFAPRMAARDSLCLAA